MNIQIFQYNIFIIILKREINKIYNKMEYFKEIK